jgi:hypothetical protein
MHQSNENSDPATHTDSSEPLPLFRPEALASQQQKLYGEILLIRPLSLAFLGWMGVGIAAAVLGFLLMGQATEKVRVFGLLSASKATPSEAYAEADLFVPARLVKFVQPGERFLLRCPGCIGPADERQNVTVKGISASTLSRTGLPQPENEPTQAPMYKVVVTLSSPIRDTSSTSDLARTKVEAEIPLGKKPLIRWLFERPGA